MVSSTGLSWQKTSRQSDITLYLGLSFESQFLRSDRDLSTKLHTRNTVAGRRQNRKGSRQEAEGSRQRAEGKG